jgi:hypothetical protein
VRRDDRERASDVCAGRRFDCRVVIAWTQKAGGGIGCGSEQKTYIDQGLIEMPGNRCLWSGEVAG